MRQSLTVTFMAALSGCPDLPDRFERAAFLDHGVDLEILRARRSR
jgi:hypothetical protein